MFSINSKSFTNGSSKTPYLSSTNSNNTQNLSFSQMMTTFNAFEQCKGCPSTQKILQNIPHKR